MNTGFNVRFHMMGLFDGFNWVSIAKPGDIISILGEQVRIDQSNVDIQNDLLYRLFSHVPWLTYRSGFPELFHDLKGTYVTDTGWGCMIRVGQMAWAQFLRRHRKITTED
jgi:cysteine protease ATG4